MLNGVARSPLSVARVGLLAVGPGGGETKEDKVEGGTGGLRGGWVRHLTNV